MTRTVYALHHSLRTRPRLAAARRAAVVGLAFLLAGGVPTAAQETGTVTGRVVAAQTLEPLFTVQVSLLGTGLGTLTADDGRYVILNVPAGTYELRTQRIGFHTASQQITVAAGETVTADFELETEVLGLDDIVVTGTPGMARRREVGNSIEQINLAEVDESPVDVDALLQARAPGMSVLKSSGMAGGGAMIRLRGNVSVAMSNQPLLYVDGIRVRSDGFAKNVPPVGYQGRSGNDIASPLNDINPADIERIEVIKGAAATTLYGTEAASGVIQVFTKKGHRGATQWALQIDQGVAYTLEFGVDPDRRPPSEPPETLAGGTSDFMFINPWLRNAHQQKYVGSVAGGTTEAFQYFVSGTWQDLEGVLPNDEERKAVVRGNFSFTPLRNLQFALNTSFTNDRIANTAAGNNAHGLTLNAYRRDRNYLGCESRECIDPFLNQEITTDIDHLITGGTAIWSPFDYMTHRLTLGWDLSQVDLRNLRPFGFIRAPLGIISDRRYEYQALTLDYVGSVDIDLTDNLRSRFSFGGQSIATEEQQTTAYGEDFPGPGQPTVTSAGSRLGFEARERVVNAGFFFQNLLDFKDRYFLTLGVRVDGNSAFGSDLGLEPYPKASLSYVISDEPFWSPTLGQLRLRAAWGQSGRAPGAFDAVRTFDPVGWGGDPAFLPRNVGNPGLGPERSTELEIGADGSFIDNRLAVDFTWYHQTTKDALFGVRQIPSLGFVGSQLENVGELRNRGVELSATGTILRSPDVTWDLGGILSTNHSKVLDLGGAPDFALGDRGWIVEDYPVPVIQGDCVRNPDELGAAPVIEQDCNIGPNQPTTIIAGHTTLRLPAGVRFTVRGEFQGGHHMYDGAAWNAVRRAVRWPGCFDFYRMEETGQENMIRPLDRARCAVGGFTDSEGKSKKPVRDFFIYPAEFFKLREVTLFLPIPSRWIPKTHTASLAITGRNIWKWVNDEFPVFEPEMSGNSGFNEQVRGILEHVPPPAVWTASLRLTF